MLYTHYIEELLGLQGVKVTNIEKEENNIQSVEKVYYDSPCQG